MLTLISPFTDLILHPHVVVALYLLAAVVGEVEAADVRQLIVGPTITVTTFIT